MMLLSILFNDDWLWSVEYHTFSFAHSTYIGVRIRSEITSEDGVGDIYVGFNSGETVALVSLPESPPGMKW